MTKVNLMSFNIRRKCNYFDIIFRRFLDEQTLIKYNNEID